MDTSNRNEEGSRRSADPEELIASRITEYQEIADAAAAKMWSGTYRSEDLIEDWFSWWGRVVRDTTATMAIGFSSMSQPGEGDAARTADDDAAPQPGDISGHDGSDR